MINNKIKDTCKRNILVNMLISFFIFSFCFNFVHKKGKGNKIKKKYSFLFKTRFEVDGNNNLISIERGVRLKKCKFEIKGNNCEIFIGRGSRFRNSSFFLSGTNSKILIGTDTQCEGASLASLEDNSSLLIGDNCMLSGDIDIRTSDSHFIFDQNDKRINPKRDISIGNHVWISAHVTILKGSVINDGAIIGINSVVTHNIDSNSIAVGIPAKCVKYNVHWVR